MRYETIKANDGSTLAFTLDPKPTAVTSAAFRLRASTAAGLGPVVTGTADYDPATGVCTVVLEPITEPGWYRLEVQVEPGPITYPSGGWFALRVVPDLG